MHIAYCKRVLRWEIHRWQSHILLLFVIFFFKITRLKRWWHIDLYILTDSDVCNWENVSTFPIDDISVMTIWWFKNLQLEIYEQKATSGDSFYHHHHNQSRSKEFFLLTKRWLPNHFHGLASKLSMTLNDLALPIFDLGARLPNNSRQCSVPCENTLEIVS